MATAKIILDNRRKNEMKIYPLQLKIYHGDDVRSISLKYKVNENDWVSSGSKVKKTYPNSTRVNLSVQKKLAIASQVFVDHEYHLNSLSINELRELVISKIYESQNPNEQSQQLQLKNKTYLVEYGKQLIERLRKAGKHGTANWYAWAINSIKQFNNNQDILLSKIDVTFLENYEAAMFGKEVKANAISAYLRAIRSIMNKAIREKENGKKYPTYPWHSYSIPHEKTRKRAVPKDVINLIRNMDLEKGSALWQAKNYFLFMFNTRGMNFIDMAKLKIKDIKNGRIEYVRSKNGKFFSIKTTSEAQQILDYYIQNKQPEEFVFPISFENSEIGRATYQQKLKRNNKRLKELAKMIGIDVNLTSYVARHSWASIAKKSGVAIPVIGEGLGHEDTKTTEIYLESFDNEVLDEANELIVN